MKKILFLALIGTALFSCSKKSNPAPTPQTPLNAAIDSKYILSTGGTTLNVAYSAFNPNADCDKKVYNAAIATVQGNYGISKITITGENLIMEFDKDSSAMPSSLSLVYGTALYKAVNQTWVWRDHLQIINLNTSLTTSQFNNSIGIAVSADGITGNVVQITSQSTVGNAMTIEYGLTTIGTPTGDLSHASFILDTTTPITLTSQLAITCLIPGLVEPESTIFVPTPTNTITPLTKTTLGNTTEYKQTLYSTDVPDALTKYATEQYYLKNIVPIIQ